MRILLVASAFNSLTQRILVELGDRGHSVAIELTVGEDDPLREAVRRHAPDLVVAPMLRTPIPKDVCTQHTCLVVHPGPPGDRGPSSLDWAVQEGVPRWGVTVLQATESLDAGPVWAAVQFRTEPVGKSDLYRGEATDAAVEAVLTAVQRFASGGYTPQPQDEASAVWRPHLPQSVRRIDWGSDSTEVVLRKLRAADSRPGVLDELLGREWYLHGGHFEDRLRGRPGELLATRAGAVCRATTDGAVWLPQLRPRRRPGGAPGFRVPAVQALGGLLPDLPEVHAPLCLPASRRTWTDIWYEESGAVGYLRFSFPGGAMNTGQCRRLLAAYKFACSRPTSVVVLGGHRDFFCNGMDLNGIEAADDPGAESWANINAMNELVEAVLITKDRFTVAALGGNAAAGGAMLALAADEVWCREGIVLNPHYRRMGLTGSEFWTYILPRRVGAEEARRLTDRALPVGTAGAYRLGLVDRLLRCTPGAFSAEVAQEAQRLAGDPRLQERIGAKKVALERDEADKPLHRYRAEELERMRREFAPGSPYHQLRAAFVRGQRAAPLKDAMPGAASCTESVLM